MTEVKVKPRRKTHAEKKELVRMMREARKSDRCNIVKSLYKEAQLLTLDIDDRLREIEREKQILQDRRIDMLKDARLNYFEENKYSQCAIDYLHPKLQEYDAETTRLEKEIWES